MNNLSQLSPEELNALISDTTMRRAIAKRSHEWFFSIYLNSYITCSMAPFHKEIFHLTEDTGLSLSIIVAFRGSGKSTLVTLSYPLWAILGVQEKKHIIIFSKTEQLARQHFMNIKRELENNELLKRDLGPFKEISDEWGGSALVLTDYGARISFASEGQSVRGMRHNEHRPDLIICDDIEDLRSVQTKEARDKTYNWFASEVIPLGSKNTKIMIVGNLLHEDSLLMRLRKKVQHGELLGAYKEYALTNEDGVCLWPEMYPTKNDLVLLEKKQPDQATFLREYQLRIVSSTGRVIHPEWIKYYSGITNWYTPREVAIGVDLAISDKSSADRTAIVTAYVYGRGKNVKFFIKPNIINKQIDFPTAIRELKGLIDVQRHTLDPWVYVESNGYMQAFCQQIEIEGYKVIDVVSRSDKRSRLALVSDLVQSGQILFPETGAEELITQLTGFGSERYDDLADAFSLLILQLIPKYPPDEGEEINLI